MKSRRDGTARLGAQNRSARQPRVADGPGMQTSPPPSPQLLLRGAGAATAQQTRCAPQTRRAHARAARVDAAGGVYCKRLPGWEGSYEGSSAAWQGRGHAPWQCLPCRRLAAALVAFASPALLAFAPPPAVAAAAALALLADDPSSLIVPDNLRAADDDRSPAEVRRRAAPLPSRHAALRFACQQLRLSR